MVFCEIFSCEGNCVEILQEPVFKMFVGWRQENPKVSFFGLGENTVSDVGTSDSTALLTTFLILAVGNYGCGDVAKQFWMAGPKKFWMVDPEPEICVLAPQLCREHEVL